MNSVKTQSEPGKFMNDEQEAAPRSVLVVLTFSQLAQLHACAMEGLYRRRIDGSETALVEESMKALCDALAADQAPLTAEEDMAIVTAAMTHLNMMKIANPNAETTPEYQLLKGAIEKRKPLQ